MTLLLIIGILGMDPQSTGTVSHRNPTPLDSKIRLAKSKGATTLELPAIRSIPPDTPSFADACKNFTVLTARTISTKTVVLESGVLRTYYKLLVTQPFILRSASVELALLNTIPDSLRPLLAGEFVIFSDGGALIRDGVKVTQLSGASDFSLELNLNYLLVIMFTSGDALGVSAAGAKAIFSIEGDRLTPLSPDYNVLAEDVRRLFDNRLSRLRPAALKAAQ